MINIEGLNKAEVLMTLYNNSRPLGMGFLQYTSEGMDMGQAQELLNETTYFDYLYGRVMKVGLESDIEFDGRLYNRDNGEGKAESLVQSLR